MANRAKREGVSWTGDGRSAQQPGMPSTVTSLEASPGSLASWMPGERMGPCCAPKVLASDDQALGPRIGLTLPIKIAPMPSVLYSAPVAAVTPSH